MVMMEAYNGEYALLGILPSCSSGHGPWHHDDTPEAMDHAGHGVCIASPLLTKLINNMPYEYAQEWNGTPLPPMQWAWVLLSP